MGNEAGGVAIRGVAGDRLAAAVDLGQRVAGAIETQGFRRHGAAGHRDRRQTRPWPGSGNHRKHDHGRHRVQHREAGNREGPRGGNRDRRFWHGLFIAALPHAAADYCAQDRPRFCPAYDDEPG